MPPRSSPAVGRPDAGRRTRVLPPAAGEIGVPATLVWRFRVASLGANLTFWTALTLGLAWLVGEAVRRDAGYADDDAAGGRGGAGRDGEPAALSP